MQKTEYDPEREAKQLREKHQQLVETINKARKQLNDQGSFDICANCGQVIERTQIVYEEKIGPGKLDIIRKRPALVRGFSENPAAWLHVKTQKQKCENVYARPIRDGWPQPDHL